MRDIDIKDFGIGIEIDASVGCASVVLDLELAQEERTTIVGLGVKMNFPAAMSAALTNWFTVTATPLSLSVPRVGSMHNLHCE